MTSQLYILRSTNELPTAWFEQLKRRVSAHRLERIEKAYSYEKAVETLLSELLMRVGIMAWTGLANERIEFGVGPFGKPFAKRIPTCEFSISHTEGLIVGIWHEEPIGIDVEKVRPIDYEAISRHYFAHDELEYIRNTTHPAERLRRFYSLWTMKESAIKSTGQGMSGPLPVINNFAGRFAVLIGGTDWRSLKPFSLTPEYQGSICGLGPEDSIACQELTIQDVIERLACDEALSYYEVRNVQQMGVRSRNGIGSYFSQGG